MTATATTRPLGMLEWDSVARGLEASDAMLKAAAVDAVVMRPITPGRYLTIVRGDVEAVRASVAAGVLRGGDSVIEQLVLASPHPGLFPAIGSRSKERQIRALGVIETLTVCSLFAAADAAAKCGDVRLHDIRLAMGLGGKAFCVLTGEVSQVTVAVESGAAVAQSRGALLTTSIMANPDPALVASLQEPSTPFRDLVF